MFVAGCDSKQCRVVHSVFGTGDDSKQCGDVHRVCLVQEVTLSNVEEYIECVCCRR